MSTPTRTQGILTLTFIAEGATEIETFQGPLDQSITKSVLEGRSIGGMSIVAMRINSAMDIEHLIEFLHVTKHCFKDANDGELDH